MSKVEVEINSKGARDLMRSEEVMKLCESYANDAMGKLGDGYVVTSYTGPNRLNVSIKAITREAVRDQYANNTILKAIGGK